MKHINNFRSKTHARPFRAFLISLLCLLPFLTFACYNADDVTYTLNITYFADGGECRQYSLEVNRGSKVAGLDPNVWTKGSWKTNDVTGDYGYIDSDNNPHYFSKFDGSYTFKSTTSSVIWKSTEPVTRDMTLIPVYQDTQSGGVSFSKINISWGKSSLHSSASSSTTYDVNTYTQSFSFPLNSDTETVTLNVSRIIKALTGEVALDDGTYLARDKRLEINRETGYGYTDWFDNGRRYVLDVENVTLKDNDGNIYSNLDKIPSDVTELSFNYNSNCGYDVMPDFLGTISSSSSIEPINLDMVFVPGTNKDGKEYPWPITENYKKGFYPNRTLVSIDSLDISTQTSTYDFPISDLMVADTPTLQSFITKIMQSPVFNTADSFGNAFYFYDADTPSTPFDSAYGLRFEDKDIGWSDLDVSTCMVMANLLTCLYNQSHSARDFTPLTYVYLNKDGSVFRDARRSACRIFTPEVIIDNDATGFRLLSAPEWQYCANVITDERTIPNSNADQDFAQLIINKSDTDYLYSFQSTDVGNWSAANNAINARHYTGSGAPLALGTIINYGNGHDYINYNSAYPRGGARALARAGDSAARTYNEDLTVKTDIQGAYDINTRNGAGLYNMSGYMFTITQSIVNGIFFYHVTNGTMPSFTNYNSSADYCIISGSSYTIPSDNTLNSSYLTFFSEYKSDNTVRFCRTVK